MLHMERKASDNKYLHKDFHVTLDLGITYIGEHFGGDDAVKEYLTTFAKAYYPKMTLPELEDYFKKIYEAEEEPEALSTELSDGCLKVKVEYCPAIKYMTSIGHDHSPWYYMTTTVVYEEWAKTCGFEFVMGDYDRKTGKTSFEFREVSK